MRKKYLSALLFGALLVTSAGTFTSCKDYDDDINNLQEQIDKLATKEDMEAKLSQMQSAIDAAKTTAEEALAKAEAAGDSEEVNDLKERVAALEEAMAKVEELKAEIKTMVDEQLGEFRVEMQEFMKEVEELTGYSLTMITEISFVASEDNSVNELNPGLEVDYARVANITYPKDLVLGGEPKTADSYVFGEGMTGAITVKKGDVNTVKDEMLVKVAPVNAVISSDMLSLINGKGEDLNSYVNMSVETWAENIESRATSKTGLYKVGVQLKNDVDFEAFDNMVLPSDGIHNTDEDTGGCDGNHAYNLFALAVSDAEKSRTVTSDYKVSLHVQKEGKVNNVYSSVLSGGPETKSLSQLAGTGTGDKLTNDYGAYQIVNGKEFKLTVNSQDNEEAKVMASYVVVDSDNPNRGLSATDKAAIKGMEIKGVNNVITGNQHKLTVSGEAGVSVPMKLVTIDYWGTVNVAYFWVSPATPALMTVAYTVTPTEYTANGKWTLTKDDMQAFKIPAGADDNNSYLNITAGEVYAEDDNTNEITDINKFNNLKLVDFILYDANKQVTTDNSKVAYAKLNKELNLKAMREDKTYSGEFKFFDENGNYLGSNTINVTKKLPTDVPAGFSAKTNTIVNGVMTVYPSPLSAGLGRYDLSESFNYWEDATPIVNGAGFGLVIKGITDTKYDDTNYWGYYNEASNNGYLSFIDKLHKDKIGEDETTYPATVKYNYGDIKYVPVGHGVDGAANYTVDWSTKFDFRFGHWIKDSKFQWTTGENPVVTYGEENIIYGKVTKTTGTDGTEKVTSVENVIEVIAPNGAEINPFDGTNANKWNTFANNFGNGNANQNVEIILKTVGEDGTERTNEFFNARFHVDTHSGYTTPMTTIQLTPVTVSEGTTVGNDVETKVYFKFTDKFGIDHNIHALTFTMKYKKN